MPREGGGILWKSPDYFPVVADNLGNQVLDDNCWPDPIFCYNDIHWQNRLFVFLIWKRRKAPGCLLLSFFKFFCQVIIFANSFVFPVPFFTLPSVKLLSASRAACFLPSFLSYIRSEPFAANRARAFSSWIFCHYFFSKIWFREIICTKFRGNQRRGISAG